MLISAVIVMYNSAADIAACLDALLSASDPQLEVIVVDNASSDGGADLVATRFPSVRLLRSLANLGFGGGNNLGFAHTRGDSVLVLNPDVRLQPGALNSLRAAFVDPAVGIAGCKLLYPDGRTLQHAGAVIDYPLATTRHRGDGEQDGGQYDQPADMPFVTGAALAMRRAVLQTTGGFDAGFYPVYYEDTDLCYRARQAGWRVVYWPAAVGLHRTSASLDPAGQTYYEYLHRNRLRFVLKHYTTEQVLRDALPAEAARLRGEMPAADRLASRRALAHWGDENVTMDKSMPTDTDRALADIERTWKVREQPFASHVPLAGPLVAAFRSAWNSISTRWYVQPMLQQQVEFNAAVLRAVQAMARRLDAIEGTDAATRLALAQRLSSVDERLARLEQGPDSRDS